MKSHLRPVPDLPKADERQAEAFHLDTTTDFSDDLKGVVLALRRHFWRFAVVFLLVLTLTVAFLYVAVPAYTGIATVILDSRKQVITNSPEVFSNVSDESSVIDTQVQLIQSRAIAGKAVDDILAQNPQFKIHQPRRFIWQVREDLDLPSSHETSSLAREALVDLFLEQLDVERIGLTSALTISYKDENPDLAARISNAISTAYIEYQSDLKQHATKDAGKQLTQRVAELKSQFETAQSKLDTYRSHAGLIQSKGATSTESQVTSLDSAVNEAQQNLSDAQSKLSTYSTALNTAGPAEAAKVVATPTMQQLRSQYITLNDQRSQLSPTYGTSHPQMMELNQQVAGLREQMAAEATRTLGELKNEVVIAQNKVNSLISIRNESRQQLATDSAASVRLAQLQSDADSLRQMYSDMMTRLQQVTSQESTGEVNAALVSQATVPGEPSFPKIKLVLAAAVGTALAFGSLSVLLAHIFDGVILRPKDLERKTGFPILALVPQLHSNDLRLGKKRISIDSIIFEKPLSLFAEAFRNLRVAVQQAAGARRSVVVQITSGSFGEGKTICSIAFAQAAAMDGRRVLLIDADVRTRSLTRTLGIDAEAGLIELLRGKAKLRDVIRSGGENRRPHVLPLSTTEAGPHDRFSSETFEEMLDVVKRGFDLIVIDSAPVLAVAESLALTRRVDMVVLVTRWARTPLEIVVKALEEIDRAGGSIVGILLTQVDVKKVTRQRFGRGHYPAMLKYYRQ